MTDLANNEIKLRQKGKNKRIYNPTSDFWVSSQLDVPVKPPKGGDQEAS